MGQTSSPLRFVFILSTQSAMGVHRLMTYIETSICDDTEVLCFQMIAVRAGFGVKGVLLLRKVMFATRSWLTAQILSPYLVPG